MSNAVSVFRTSVQCKNQNEYRLVWNNPNLKGVQYGAFLFNTRTEFEPALDALRKNFPDYVIWVEDREHNRVDVREGGV